MQDLENEKNGKTESLSISTTPLRFHENTARTAFKYQQIIYIAKN